MKTFKTLFLGVTLVATIGFVSGCTTPAPSSASNIDYPKTPQFRALDPASWELVWDDKVDDSLDRESKTCRLRLVISSGKVTGRFDGPVLGHPRKARFTGKLIGAGTSAILTMEQREPNYTCVYQLQGTGDGYFGTWCDDRGRKGDVQLRRISDDTSISSSQ